MAYTGEWERYVCEVTLAGRPDLLRQAARQWEKTFARVNDMAELVYELARKSESWRGGGAEAFRVHLADLRKALQRTASEHKKVFVGLDACARHLERAMLGVRTPQWLFDEIQDMQDRAVAQGVRSDIPPGHFGRTIMAQMQQVAQRAGGTLSADDLAMMRKNLDEGEDLSRAAYETLGRAYSRLVGEMPGGSTVRVPTVNAAEAPKKAGNAATNQVAQQNPPQAAASTVPTTTAPAPAPSTGDLGGGLDLPGTEPSGVDLDPFTPGTGLAGVDDLKGAGFTGGGGVGGGGIGKVPIGETVATPAVAMAGTGTAGAAVRGGSPGTGATRTATPMMGGMMGGMGGMAGAGANNQAAARNTCLREDDDLFTPDRCVPSGVLDA